METKAYYIDDNTNLSDIEEKLATGWGVLPITNDRLLILIKQEKKKIVTPRKK